MLMITYNLPCRQGEAGKELQTVPSPCPEQAAQQGWQENRPLPAAASASTKQTPLEGSFLFRFPKKGAQAKSTRTIACRGRNNTALFLCWCPRHPLGAPAPWPRALSSAPRGAPARALPVPGAVGNTSPLTTTLSWVMCDRRVKNKALFRHFRCLNIVFGEGK